jgi:hypothetical protein
MKEVTVTNYKGYPIYIDLHLQSLNGCLEFLESGKTEYHVARKVLPPAERGNPTRKTFGLQVSQYAEALNAEDSIRVDLTYYDREDALEESKNDSIPEVFPRSNWSDDRRVGLARRPDRSLRQHRHP